MTKEQMIELLKHHDSVYVRLTGVGETYLCSTKELAEIIQDSIDLTLVLSNQGEWQS